jgi:hypothetical protein
VTWANLLPNRVPPRVISCVMRKGNRFGAALVVATLAFTPTIGCGRSAIGASDAGIDAQPSCSPQQVVLRAFVPPRAPRSACTDTQIQALYVACSTGAGGDEATCNAFKGDPDNSPCLLCMYTEASDDAYGAIIHFPDGTDQANAGGCIALLNPGAGSAACAAAAEAIGVCRHEACEATCPGGSTTSGLQTFDQCESQADTTVCAQYVDAGQCDQAVQYVPCLFADYQAAFLGLGRIFCEAKPDGSSVAAGPDAAAD